MAAPIKTIPVHFTARDRERFWAKVDKRGADDCWIWKGASGGRYGQFWCSGAKYGAHRIAFALAGGVFADGEVACHRCDVTLCVNPAHLFAGTMSDNLKDAVRKGRWVSPISKNPPRRIQTHCKRGHPLDADKVAVSREGYRDCKICKVQRQRERRASARIDALAKGGVS